ncbi:VOC family protein [Bacillus sp. V3-13]|uniref:VOC family protein n=1 Tax=Bacillus sp. V3-13 TaxID=2053728 RepID=UPI002152362B|nr:VOC family protein [Bacillus sp. V3-13]
MFKVGSIFIPVTDMEKSKKWYETNLGVIKADEWKEELEHRVGNFSRDHDPILF